MTIISARHQFIFIKTRKVAGTSVESVLRKFAGPDDIVTTLTPRDELHCARQGLHARNYARRKSAEARYTELVLAEQLDHAKRFSSDIRKKYDGHMRAREVRRKLGRARYAGLYKFTIERNPYTWLISIARYDKESYHSDTMAAVDPLQIRQRILERLSRRKLLERANYGYYTIKGKLAVDRVICYENLEEEFSEVMQHLGLRFDAGVGSEGALSLPRLKFNPHPISAAEIFTPELEALVQERFKPVFDLMGYPRSVAALVSERLT